ncbi:hypothetical protein ACTA71_006624 [Dictyostelium dimigraforme]
MVKKKGIDINNYHDPPQNLGNSFSTQKTYSDSNLRQFNIYRSERCSESKLEHLQTNSWSKKTLMDKWNCNTGSSSSTNPSPMGSPTLSTSTINLLNTTTTTTTTTTANQPTTTLDTKQIELHLQKNKDEFIDINNKRNTLIKELLIL